jgi:hypothetical protein
MASQLLVLFLFYDSYLEMKKNKPLPSEASVSGSSTWHLDVWTSWEVEEQLTRRGCDYFFHCF